jgi:hypothetical protein
MTVRIMEHLSKLADCAVLVLNAEQELSLYGKGFTYFQKILSRINIVRF